MEHVIKTLICHGDSLIEASDLDRTSTWPYQVADRLKINVINSGIGGDTTGGLLGRFYPAVVQHQADAVLIMGGTNDLWWDLDAKLIRANIFTMACQATHHDIIPLVGLPPPILMEKAHLQDFAGPAGGYARLVEQLRLLVKALKLAAGQNEVACLDFHRPFLDNAGNPIEEYFLDDGLHPNQAGHSLMADIVIEMLSGL
ncbi:MAG: GDSL-type esterase/lipase family protein [Desulfobacterales bacterium]|jgi:lysophospholipase L1-like esterase